MPRDVDNWTTTKAGTKWQNLASDDPRPVPEIIEKPGGPWSATRMKVRGVTAKGNATSRDFAMLVHKSAIVRQQPLRMLHGLESLANRLNGWEVARYFAPGKPEDWRKYCKLPPESD